MTSVFNVLPLAWDISSFLANSKSTLITWGGALIMVIGVIMILFGVYKIAKALISHGKDQTSWPINILLLVIGGALLAGGWTFVASVANGGVKTLNDLGGGTILPFFLY